MLIKHCAGTLLFLLGFAGVSSHAAGVSCLVIETGLRMESPGSAISALWEDGLMEALFEAGHIATNAPILRVEKHPVKEFSGETMLYLDEALANGMDYLIIALLEYQVKGGKTSLESASLSLFSTNPQRMVFTRQFSNIGAGSGVEASKTVQQAAQSVISHIEG